MTDKNVAPIACTLGADDFDARRAFIAGLARDALLRHTRHDLKLRLVYALDAADRVREMVRKERDCCAFLSFHLDEWPNAIHLTITAPERARGAVDGILALFLPAGEESTSCGCC